ncbi:putative nuclease HARBI1, partial [Aphis craccivora]
MPGVGGCIDCTHIRIQNPGGINGEVFRNCKGWFSLNVQLVCGPSMEIYDLVVRWPGSYHDSFIFNASHACAVYSNNNHNLIRLGDNAMFGVWKRKFPCLRRGLTNLPNTIVSKIVACAVLYNISLKLRLVEFPVKDEINKEVNHFLNNENREIVGAAARRAYI